MIPFFFPPGIWLSVISPPQKRRNLRFFLTRLTTISFSITAYFHGINYKSFTRSARTLQQAGNWDTSNGALFVFGATAPSGSGPPHLWGFIVHTQRYTTVDKTPLNEWSSHRRDIYLTATTTTTRNMRHPCPRWNSNPQSQQASGRRPTL